MQDLNDKITGNSLTANEWNEMPTELQNIIEAVGQTLSAGDLEQVRKSLNLVFISFTELRAVAAGMGTVLVSGYAASGDGGGGEFYWDSASTETDNDGTIIKATSITTGRWKRLVTGEVNVKWFGAVGDGATDDSTAIQASIDAVTASKGIVFFPESSSSYFIASALTVPRGVTLKGLGHDSPSTIECDTLNNDITFITLVGYAQIESLNIEGNSTTQGILVAITGGIYTFTGNVKLKDVRITGAEVGLFINSVFNLVLDNVEVIYNVIGVDMSPLTDAGDNGYINVVSFNSCYFIGNTDYDVYANPAVRMSDIVFNNCTFDPGPTIAKVYAFTSYPLSFNDCYFEGGSTVPAFSGYLSTVGFTACYFNGTKGVLLDATVAGTLYMERCRTTSTDIIDCNYALHVVRLKNQTLPSSGNVFLTGQTRFWDDAIVNGTTYDQVGAPAGHTPVLTGASTPGSPTYATQTMRYQVIGKRCFFNGRVAITAIGGMIGSLEISLPFTAVNVSNTYSMCALGTTGVTPQSGKTSFMGRITPNTALMLLYQDGDATGLVPILAADIAATTSFFFSGDFEIA